MSIITVKNLEMIYKIRAKEEGIKGSIKNLFTKEYSVVEAVNNVSFTVNQGDFIGLIGANGAGKTTIIKILSGILTPVRGEVSVLGFTPAQRKNEYKKSISVVMGQRSQLWWDLPAVETFLINKEIYDIPTKLYSQRLDYLVELLDVKDKIRIPVRRLSLGERMKMELIASFLHFPKVLFLDEPTIGLDILSQRKIWEFLKMINREEGTTIILTSHYIADIVELCNKVMIINHGNIVFNGPLDKIEKKYNNHVVVTFELDEPVHDIASYAYSEILNYSANKITYKIKNDELHVLCEKVLKDLRVRDINIDHSSIEDIICDILTAN